MIASLKGTIITKSEPTQKRLHVIVDVLGVGYRVTVSSQLLFECVVGSEKHIFTHLHVTENSQELFGFESKETSDFFMKLLEVSGIGPKSALQILDKASIEDIQSSIASQDVDILTSKSSVSKAVAEKIVLGLKKYARDFYPTQKGTAQNDMAVIEALEALGFSADHAREALKKIPQDLKDSEQKVREALKILGS